MGTRVRRVAQHVEEHAAMRTVLHAHGDLAVFLLREHPAVLTGDTDRMLAFLRNAGVEGDPGDPGGVTLHLCERLVATDALYRVSASHGSFAAQWCTD